MGPELMSLMSKNTGKNHSACWLSKRVLFVDTTVPIQFPPLHHYELVHLFAYFRTPESRSFQFL